VPDIFYSDTQRLKCNTGHSSRSIAEAWNTWSDTSTPSYAFITWYVIQHREKFPAFVLHTVVLISPSPVQEGNKLGRMSGTRAISTTSRRELSSFFFLQGKGPKEIQVILTETLACFLPGRTKDLSAPLYVTRL